LSASSTTDLATAQSAGPAPAAAVLLLDSTGRITAANATARTLWQVSESELIGEWFSSLFFFEVVSEGADWLEAQWDVILATTLERTTALSIQPREGAPRPQNVRLEPALGGATGYIAVVQSAPAAVAPAAREDGLNLLVEQNVVGFFDLHFKADRIYYSPVWKNSSATSIPNCPTPTRLGSRTSIRRIPTPLLTSSVENTPPALAASLSSSA